jgi:hypothetical protein
MSSKIEKTISFKTEGGNEVVQQMGSFNDKIKAQGEELIKSAQSSAKSSDEVIKNLEREVALLEKKNNLERQNKIKEIKNDTTNYVKEKEDELKRLKANPKGMVRGYDGTLREAFSSGYLSENPTETEKIIGKKRKGISEDINSAKEGANEEISQLISEGETQNQLLRKLIEVYKQGVRDQIQEDKNSTNETIEENRFIGAGVVGKNGGGGSGGGGGNNGKDGKGDGEKEEDDKRNWKEVMKGILAAGAVKEVLGGLRRGGEAFLNTQSGDEFVEAEMFTAIPFVGQGLAAINKRSLEQQQARQIAINKLRKRTGSDNYGDAISDIGLGIDGVEGTNFASQYATTRGYYGMMSRDSKDAFSLKQAYDVDEGTLMGRAKVEKNLGSESVSNSIINLINVLKSNNSLGDDLSRLPKLIEIQNQLIEDGSKFSGTINDTQLAKTIAGVVGMGGKFTGNPNFSGEIIGNVNNSLRTAPNEYQQAMHYAALQQLNPNDDYLGIKMKEEQSLQTPGYLRKMMELIKRQNAGDRSSGVIATSKAFGLNLNQSADFFDNFGGYDDSTITKMFETKGSVRQRGERNTTEIEAQRASVNEEFAKGIIPGIKEAGKQIGQSIAKSIKDLTKDSFLFEGMGKKMANGMLEVLGAPKSGGFNNSKPYKK